MAERISKHVNTRLWGLILASIGLIDSGYLSWIQISHSVERCIPGLGDCAKVNSSVYSRLYGIPVAYLGFLTYLTVFLLLVIQPGGERFSKIRDFVLFGITLTGFLFSMYLTYVQFGLLQTFCPYCLLSAVTTTGLFVVSIINIVRDFHNI
jgi:uncharacterized membrane protein